MFGKAVSSLSAPDWAMIFRGLPRFGKPGRVQPWALMVLMHCIVLGALSGVTQAKDAEDQDLFYSEGELRQGDFKWFQFNVMQSADNRLPYGNEKDTYLEMEFGGRSGIIQLYGYLDVFDLFNTSKDDLHDRDNFFFKFAPRFSLDGIFRTDLSFGPVKEVFLSTLTNVADNGAFGGLFEHFVGLGVDIKLPWFGVVGSNLLAHYSRENYGAGDEGKWSGYIWTTNWFKPFYHFANKSFISYQGYFDYKFDYDELAKEPGRTKDSIEWFNGFYWHSDHYALGYGAKYYRNMANFKDGSSATGFKQNTSGFGHYFSATYKF